MNPSPSATIARKRCVFIVDDHPLVREGLTNLINRQSDLIVCGEAKDSAEAIAGIAKERPDVAIIDISLTNESGLELIKHLVRQFPQVAFIVLSMHDEALYAERALRAGARGYVMKHETSKSVLASIRRVLGGEIYGSERIVNRMALRLTSSGRAVARSPVERLSDRELEILELIGKGRDVREIAKLLHLSPKTVETHRAHIKEKLNLANARQVACYAVQWIDQKAI